MAEYGITLAAGDVVSGLDPSELVEVRRVSPFGGRTLVEGVGVQSRREVRRPLTEQELQALAKIRGIAYTFDGEPEVFLLGAEAERIKIAHQFDPLFAVNSSIVDPLPHQVEAVYRYLLPLPRIRFLLADDTGAKPMIATKEAVTEGLAQACLDGVIGIGRGVSPSSLQARYCRQRISIDPTEDGLWIIPPFEPETPKIRSTETVPPPTEVAGGRDSGAPGTTEATTPERDRPPTVPTPVAKVRRFVVSGAVPLESYGELFRCFVGPAARMNLKKLNLGVQFEMQASEENALEADDPTLKSMREAANQLGLTFEVEE